MVGKPIPTNLIKVCNEELKKASNLVNIGLHLFQLCADVEHNSGQQNLLLQTKTIEEQK